MQHNHERVGFGSKIGAILAAAGSAVGLGNIWRFPFETGNHGGAAFILIYLGCVFIFGLPIMIAEFTIGPSFPRQVPVEPIRHWHPERNGSGSAIWAYSPDFLFWVITRWLPDGHLSMSGRSATGGFAGKSSTEFITMFQEFSQDPLRPLLWLFIFMLLTHFIIVKGVEKGIERSSKVMMPILFILVVLLAICSVTLPGAEKGVEFFVET